MDRKRVDEEGPVFATLSQSGHLGNFMQIQAMSTGQFLQ